MACELLSRAIELYLRGDSYYSAIHLAGAAEEVLAVLVRNLPTESGESDKAPIDHMKAAIVAFSSPTTTEEANQIENWAYNRMTVAKNSVKHMRGLRDGGVDFDPVEEAGDIVDRAISTYFQLGNRIRLPLVSRIAEFDAAHRAPPGGE